ncbi:MAG TPA: peptidoglycan-binding protein [Negativicutes bacterium]|nr:peptidoglycan-binding protein [Negativicutes bacterium]
MNRSKQFIFLLVLIFSLTSFTYADTLKYGSGGAEVTKLQQRLKQLGYFKADITGYYGSLTQAAVKKFQAARGISTTGTVGPQTTKALSSAGTSSKGTTAKATTAAEKEMLKKVQDILKKMGLYKGKTDGINGSMTKSAIKAFQKKYGMKATGTLDKDTQTKVLNHFTVSTASSRSGSSSDGQAFRAEAVNADAQETQVISETAEEAADAAAALEDTQAPEGEEQGEQTETNEDKEPSESETKGKIETLDWWTHANKVFARGTTAKVIDVRTGKSFYIKRTYGGNHADCEALTKEDTEIIKEIWGGFSWNRRPVLVEIKGRYLAASMSGMPHAGLDNKPANITVSSRSEGYGRGVNLDTVKGNGMNGHFDVHFKNSRTHGTNRVDPAHQKAIKEAAAAKLDALIK